MRPIPLWLACVVALFSLCCAPDVHPPPDLARVLDSARAVPDVAPVGSPRHCCECDVREPSRGGGMDLPAVCIVPCAVCLHETGRDGGGAGQWSPMVDFAAVADFGACECTGARL